MGKRRGGGTSSQALGICEFHQSYFRPKCLELHVIRGLFQEKSANLFSVIRDNSTVANILHWPNLY